MSKIAIIGAGITGLTAAYTLIKKGFSVDVFDKSPVPGGVIQTLHQNGFLCELGPETLQLNDARILNLLNELNLQNDIIETNPISQNRYIVKNAHPTPVPRSPIAFLKTSLLSTKAKLRLLKEPFIKKGHNPNETIADFIKRRLGQEFLDYAIDPFVSGGYAGDPNKLSIQYAFPKLYTLEASSGSLIKGALKKQNNPFKIKTRTISFKNGMHTLPAKLAKTIKDSLHLNSTILSISNENLQWEITYKSLNTTHTQSYSNIIVTIPAHQLQDLPFNPTTLQALSPLKNISYAPIAVVTHAFKKESLPNALQGFGMLIPSKENLKTLGTLFTSSIFPSHAPEGFLTFRTFIGGSQLPNIYKESPETIENMAWNDLVKLLNIKDIPVYSHVHTWKNAIPQYNLGYQKFFNTMDKAENSFPGLHLMGNYRTGISLPQCILAGLNVMKNLNIYV